MSEAPATRIVNCDGCTMCCRGEMIALDPARDDFRQYVTVIAKHPLTGLPARFIPQVDGACHYLGDGGCTIWEKRPIICRVFFSAEAFKNTPRAERRRRVRSGLRRRARANDRLQPAQRLPDALRRLRRLRHHEGSGLMTEPMSPRLPTVGRHALCRIGLHRWRFSTWITVYDVLEQRCSRCHSRRLRDGWTGGPAKTGDGTGRDPSPPVIDDAVPGRPSK